MAKTPNNAARRAKKEKTVKKAKKQSRKATKKAAKKAGKKVGKKKKAAKQSASSQTTTAASSGTMFPASFKIENGVSEDEILGDAFATMIARGNQHNKSPVCYSQLSDGIWEVCLLQTDGSYGQCERYNGPIHGPICGG